MSSTRLHIRNAVVAALAGVTAVAGRVYNQRVWPHTTLPCLTVRTPSSGVVESWMNLGSTGPRDVSVIIEGRAEASANLENELDDLDAAVEAALQADTALAALLLEPPQYRGMVRQVEMGGPKPRGMSRLAYLMRYSSDAAPEPAAPTFSALTADEGCTAINFGCTTSRLAIVRFRLQKLVAGAPTGAYYRSTWESVAKTTGHLRQVSGLTPSTPYRCWIEINATADPDLSWSLFSGGGVGPDFTTGEAPYDPNQPTEE